MKKTAKILGMIWMIFFGFAAVYSMFSQSFDFSTSGGMGYFFGFLISLIVVFLIGYFAYR
jgi:hypothetical protein